jgi:hypothetical protein
LNENSIGSVESAIPMIDMVGKGGGSFNVQEKQVEYWMWSKP